MINKEPIYNCFIKTIDQEPIYKKKTLIKTIDKNQSQIPKTGLRV